MRAFLGSGWVAFALVVASWRALSELVARHRNLAASGRLDQLVAARTFQRREHALVRARSRHASRAPRPGCVAHQHASHVSTAWRCWCATHTGRVAVAAQGVHQSVQIGRIPYGDVDDIGLLEAAMRRSVLDAASSTSHPSSQPALTEVSERSRRHLTGSALVLAGVALTFVPLVRPLAEGAPALAIAGISLAVAGWLLSRGR